VLDGSLGRLAQGLEAPGLIEPCGFAFEERGAFEVNVLLDHGREVGVSMSFFRFTRKTAVPVSPHLF
jgi:hypothetical protein